MEIWIFVIGFIVGSALCVILSQLSMKLDNNDDTYEEYYVRDFEEDNIESKVNYSNMNNKELEITKEDINTLITMICKKQLHMIKKDSYLYDSDKYNNLELLKAKLNYLNDNK